MGTGTGTAKQFACNADFLLFLKVCVVNIRTPTNFGALNLRLDEQHLHMYHGYVIVVNVAVALVLC